VSKGTPTAEEIFGSVFGDDPPKGVEVTTTFETPGELVVPMEIHPSTCGFFRPDGTFDPYSCTCGWYFPIFIGPR
jgi:hypothetical protein